MSQPRQTPALRDQPSGPRVGLLPLDLLDEPNSTVSARLAEMAGAGIDHVCCGDHVSFGGDGFDGLIQAAALAMAHPSLPVHIAIYLLPLRHPVLVARQVADVSRIAPGRLVFGVGIGGEDRHEVSICGVDARTRGRRMDESLAALSDLLSGSAATVKGEFFDIDQAVISPPPEPSVPIIVGGRSDAAAMRAGRFADGWIGIWNSPRRFRAVAALAAEEADRSGRSHYPARHAMQVWCGFGATTQQAREPLAAAMRAFYRLPFEMFERYCPYGRPEQVAEFLAPYVEAGCHEFNLIPQSADLGESIQAVAEVRRMLT